MYLTINVNNLASNYLVSLRLRGKHSLRYGVSSVGMLDIDKQGCCSLKSEQAYCIEKLS